MASSLKELIEVDRLAPLLERAATGDLTLGEIETAMLQQQHDLARMGRIALAEAIQRNEEFDDRAAAIAGAD